MQNSCFGWFPIKFTKKFNKTYSSNQGGQASNRPCSQARCKGVLPLQSRTSARVPKTQDIPKLRSIHIHHHSSHPPDPPDPPPKEHHDHAKDGSPGRKLEMPLPDYRIYRTGCGQYLELSGTCCVCAMYVCSLPNSCEVLRGLSLQLCNPNTFLPFCFDKPVNGTTKVPQLPPAPGLNTWSGAAINEVGWVKLLLILIGSSYLNFK